MLENSGCWPQIELASILANSFKKSLKWNTLIYIFSSLVRSATVLIKMFEDSADNFVSELVRDNWNVVIWGRTIDTIIRDIRPVSTHACISFPAHFALNDPSQWIRASSLYSLVFISMFLTWMQLMMLKLEDHSPRFPRTNTGASSPTSFVEPTTTKKTPRGLKRIFSNLLMIFAFRIPPPE